MTASTVANPDLPLRRGGLLDAGKQALSPVFAILIAFLAIDTAIIVVPWFLDRANDGPWASPDRMGFLAKSMATSIAFGLVAALAAETRGRSPWWFLSGHLGFPLALILARTGVDQTEGATAMLGVIASGFAGTMAGLWASGTPAVDPWKVGPVTRAFGRATFSMGNLWFGIVLLASLTAISAYGTFYEENYGTKAVQHTVYRSWWFGALFFVTGLSMLSATFRKWPFRLEQVGWLVVHTGLAMLTIGSMMSLLLSLEGSVAIKEGATVSSIGLATRSQIVVEQRTMNPDGKINTKRVLTATPSFDLNPAVKEPTEKFTVTADGIEPFELVFDRYYGTGQYRQDWNEKGERRRLAVEARMSLANSGRSEVIRLDEIDNPASDLGFGSVRMETYLLAAPPQMFDALSRTEPSAWPAKLEVVNANGSIVLTLDIPEPSDQRPEGDAAPLNLRARIPGTDIDVAVTAWADNLAPTKEGSPFQDSSPGNPSNPAALVTLRSPKGEDRLETMSFFPEATSKQETKHAYTTRLNFAPRIIIPPSTLLFVDVDGTMKWIWSSSSGGRPHGIVKLGEPLALPMPAFSITPTAVYHKLAIEESFDFAGYKADLQATHFRVERNGVEIAPSRWLSLDKAEAQTRGFAIDKSVFRVTWAPKPTNLGFSLMLTDFHRDFYPGSTQPKTFESYCVLTHPAKFPSGADIKIDMNHPLRLDGWRLYQARYAGEGTMTILQVNRDPGLVLIYPATAVVFLGLIVVFFMKRPLTRLRLDLESRQATTTKHVTEALVAILKVGAGPAVFGIAVFLGVTPTGTLGFVGGLVLLVVAPIFAIVRTHRRWPTPPSAEGSPA